MSSTNDNWFMKQLIPVSIYLLKVNNRKTRTCLEEVSLLLIFTHCPSFSTVNFENIFAGWVTFLVVYY